MHIYIRYTLFALYIIIIVVPIPLHTLHIIIFIVKKMSVFSRCLS